MRFHLIDNVIECDESRIVAVKQVSLAEEYLQDHFPTFPVLPGVMMLEVMVQAARELLTRRDRSLSRHVLGEVRALKYGAMVRPGQTLVVTVTLVKELDDGVFDFKGLGEALGAAGANKPTGRQAVAGRFALRPLDPEAGPR